MLPGQRSLKGRIIDLAIVATAAGLVYVPWAPTMIAQSQAMKGNFWAQVPDRRMLLRTLGLLAGVNDKGVGWISIRAMSGMSVLFLGFLVLGFLRRQTVRRAVALSAFGLVPLLFVFVYSHFRQPIFIERAFMPTTIVTPLLIALPLVGWRACVSNRMRDAGIAAAALLWVLPCVLSIRSNYLGEHQEDWRSVCAFSTETKAQNRLVIFVANEGELLYDYYARGGDYAPSSNVTGVPDSFFAADMNPPRTMRRMHSDGDLNLLSAKLGGGGFDEVVLVVSHPWWADRQQKVFRFLCARFLLRDHREIDQIDVYRFGVMRS